MRALLISSIFIVVATTAHGAPVGQAQMNSPQNELNSWDDGVTTMEEIEKRQADPGYADDQDLDPSHEYDDPQQYNEDQFDGTDTPPMYDSDDGWSGDAGE
jgi:hypothetical protein